MFRNFKEILHSSKIISLRQYIKNRSFEIVEKMEKLADHLDIIKNDHTNNSDVIYNKNKNIIINLYGYYCKYMKLYIDISFSQILMPIDKDVIRKMDIKEFADGLKNNYRNDYEITVKNFKNKDKSDIEFLYMDLIKNIDELVNILIKIQSSIIFNEVSPINESATIEKLNNTLSYDYINKNYINMENNYNEYITELSASKEIFE